MDEKYYENYALRILFILLYFFIFYGVIFFIFYFFYFFFVRCLVRSSVKKYTVNAELLLVLIGTPYAQAYPILFLSLAGCISIITYSAKEAFPFKM